MELIELAVQGIRRFNSALRFIIKDGYNVFFGPNECGKTTLFECVASLLDKKFFDEKIRTFIPWDTVGSPSRAGLVFKVGPDQLRMIKDFTNDTTLLSRFVGEDNFEPLSRDSGWVHSHMNGTLGIPSGDVLLRLLMSSSQEYDRYYSALPVAGNINTPNIAFQADNDSYELGEGVHYVSGEYNEEDAIKARLQQLKEELILVEQINEIQFQVDGLQSKVFEIESKLKEIRVFDDKIKEIDEELKNFEQLTKLPEGIEIKLQNLKLQEEAKNKELSTLIQDKQFASRELAASMGVPFYKEIPFIAGAATAIPFLIAQFALSSLNISGVAPFLKFFPVIWIGGWGMLFYSAWKEISRRDKEQKARKRFQEIEERIRTVSKKYDLEAILIKNILHQAKIDSPDQLIYYLDQVKLLRENKKKLEEEKEGVRSKYNLDELLKQKKDLEDKVKENEERLQLAGGFSMDPNEMKKEIRKLEGLLKPSRPASVKPQKMDVKPAIVTENKTPPPGSMPLPGLLELASGFMKKSPDEILAVVSENLRNNLANLTGGLYSSVSSKTADTGRNILIVRKDGKELEWKHLSPSSREGVYFAVKLALLDEIVKSNPLPLIMDEPFVYADEARIVAAAKILRTMSTRAKILHFTSRSVFAKAGSQVYNLKVT
ncbi:MAG TPA: hypothetical protein VII00_03650 [bacterium]